MSKRKLKRQLNLTQVIMLGTAGTIAAEIFVLTGHAAGMAGPAAVLALLVGGLLSYSVALNYCELGATYPVAGGAMSYVREAFGTGLLSFLVGSMDCLSSTFYAALSAVGFAYSLKVFLPFIPIVPTAIVVIALFSFLNILGVTKVGNAQIVLGGILLAVFVLYVVAGFVHPQGFSWGVFISGESIFAHTGFWANFTRIMATIALVYNAYVGFEVIADDAEEVSNPSRNIPRGILISLTLCTLIYVSVGLVTLGTVPWQELAGSETALTDAVRHFIPGWGVPMMAIAGMVATLTSINSAMLSATREAFSLGRDGVWPRMFSKLSRFRTPHMAILIIGGISALVAIIGLVDFLSYISSSGYLFVLFWSSLSMIRLRKLYPDIERPFKAPFFPLTAYLAGLTCLLIIAFADWRALLFGGGVLFVFALAFYALPPFFEALRERRRTAEPDNDLILIAAANPQTVKSLVHLASIVAQASADTYVCVMSVITTSRDLPLKSAQRIAQQLKPQQQSFLRQVATDVSTQNIALYSKVRAAHTVSEGILEEIASRHNLKLLLAGWPGHFDPKRLAENPVKVVLQKARTNMAVLLDRGLEEINLILVPVGGGIHSRMALRLANEIAMADDARVVALRLLTEPVEEEEIEDQHLYLAEIIEEALEEVPENFELRVAQAESIQEGILAEANRLPYDLIVVGASEEWARNTRLFGSVDDWVAEHVHCSVVLCRRYEPVTLAWLRYQIKTIDQEYSRNGHNADKA
ncbi:MAG TPA: amino acid permease [Anaerolineae bacterium]|nr:amino acid permease [Anaerolineae bacterium]HQI86953.1 amino acid permease [Anaerolineae bacterium]